LLLANLSSYRINSQSQPARLFIRQPFSASDYANANDSWCRQLANVSKPMILGFVFGQADKQPRGYLFSCWI